MHELDTSVSNVGREIDPPMRQSSGVGSAEVRSRVRVLLTVDGYGVCVVADDGHADIGALVDERLKEVGLASQAVPRKLLAG